VVEVTQKRESDPRDGLTSEQLSTIGMMARGASRLEAAVAHGMSEERVKGWERTSWFPQALAREQESPWINGKTMAIAIRGSGKPADPPTSRSTRRTMAIDMLESGVSITETASSVGYTRQHLSQLVHHDPAFLAERQLRRVEAQQRRADRLWHIHDLAASVIETSLEEGDSRTALEIFKLMARGVTDVHHHTEDSQLPQIESTPTKAIADPPKAMAAEADLPSGITCRDCGKVAKTEGGMKQHRKAKHEN
jgi:hypothetical protein